ncbi:hypothetical protein [Candidatus Babela massiliensis]|uniref:Uncharacterized protein n=1 Tax=Candidatus Babela massiliensis TaxID=673862 RepID=V6DHB3_9BACT|nr:hypothetical protein [Candidatus Babela massiliensis]CDK30950.1 hypothetical protein BABL1_gene_84 [Candidatus Babela massiliensis]
MKKYYLTIITLILASNYKYLSINSYNEYKLTDTIKHSRPNDLIKILNKIKLTKEERKQYRTLASHVINHRQNKMYINQLKPKAPPIISAPIFLIAGYMILMKSQDITDLISNRGPIKYLISIIGSLSIVGGLYNLKKIPYYRTHKQKYQDSIKVLSML